MGPPTTTSEANERSMPYLTSREVIGVAGLEPHALAEGEGPGQPVVRGLTHVGGQVGHERVGPPRLGRVGDQRPGVEPHEVPHARRVGALRVEAARSRRRPPAACRPSASEGARTPSTAASAPSPSTGTDVAGVAAAAGSWPPRRPPGRPRRPGRRSGRGCRAATTGVDARPAPACCSRPPLPAAAGSGQLPSAAIRQICANSSASRLAPPTRAPSTSGPARIPAVFAAFTDPP